ncbi:MAG: hypothetical protein PHH04_06955 [Thomasclavelia sp.]|jgi:hypothetical protein|nr:hypothetical protein [Thomasclavelia sp.]
MYFCINIFIAACCLSSLILFKDVFNKFFKFVFGLLGTFTFAFAMVKLYDKIADLSGWYTTTHAITPTLYYTFAASAVVVLIVLFFLKKKDKKKAK